MAQETIEVSTGFNVVVTCSPVASAGTPLGLKFQTRWDKARNPNELQTKYEAFFTREQALQIVGAIQAGLKELPA